MVGCGARERFEVQRKFVSENQNFLINIDNIDNIDVDLLTADLCRYLGDELNYSAIKFMHWNTSKDQENCLLLSVDESSILYEKDDSSHGHWRFESGALLKFYTWPCVAWISI